MKIVTAAIIIQNEQVLLARRKSDEVLSGFWEFPGGKIEQNETPKECLERELLEEFGVESKACGIFAESIYSYEHGTIKLLALRVKLLQQDLTLSVHDKVEWVSFGKLSEYKLAPADIPIAKQLGIAHGRGEL